MGIKWTGLHSFWNKSNETLTNLFWRISLWNLGSNILTIIWLYFILYELKLDLNRSYLWWFFCFCLDSVTVSLFVKSKLEWDKQACQLLSSNLTWLHFHRILHFNFWRSRIYLICVLLLFISGSTGGSISRIWHVGPSVVLNRALKVIKL